MARFIVGSPEVQRLVEQLLVPLYLESSSVAATAKAVGDLAQAAGVAGIVHPNRIHSILSDDGDKGLNQQTMDLLRAAHTHLAKRSSDERLSDGARLSELGARAKALSAGETPDVMDISERLGVPPAVVRVALEKLGSHVPRGSAVSLPLALPGPDWSFQDEAVARCLDAFRRRPAGNVGLVLPTGAGKTRTAFRIILETLAAATSTTSKAVWITHRRSLRSQAIREMMRLVERSPHSLPANAEELSNRVVFAMVGTAVDALEAGEPPALVVVDEAHHAAAPIYRPVFEARHPFPLLLLTATPIRPDALPIGIDEIAFTITYRELADRGVIIRPEFETFPVKDFTLSDETMDDLVDRLVAETGHRFRKTLVLVSRVEQMQTLHERLVEALADESDHPIAAEDVGYIHGGGNSHGADAEDFLARFAEKPRAILISAQMLLEGFDDPAIDAVVITYRTESVIKLMQAAGRCVRYAPGKTRAWVVQADNPALAYRFDERWLYQEIDDRLRPQLRDVEFGDMDEMLVRAAALLKEHRVDQRGQAEAIAAISRCSPDAPPRMMFYGLPYFDEDFENEAQWGVLVETAANSEIFRAIYNGFSALGADQSDPTEFLDVKGPGLGLPRDAVLRRQLGGMLTAAYFAREELAGKGGASQTNRGYKPHHSTTWLRYVVLKHRPSVPARLSAFLVDCHNRGSLEEAYAALPAGYALAVKTALPFGGFEGVLLEQPEAAALDAWLTALRDELRTTAPADQLSTLAAAIARLRPPPLPMAHVVRAELLLSETGRAALTLNIMISDQGDPE